MAIRHTVLFTVIPRGLTVNPASLPVAVLVSPEQLDAHSKGSQTLADAYRAWRTKFHIDTFDLDPDEVFRDVRDRGPGRDVP